MPVKIPLKYSIYLHTHLYDVSDLLLCFAETDGVFHVMFSNATPRGAVICDDLVWPDVRVVDHMTIIVNDTAAT